MASAPHDRLQQRRRKRPLSLLLLVLTVAGMALWRAYPPRERGVEPSGRSDIPAGAETVARRNIFDRRYRPLAVSVELVSVYAQPRRVKLDKGQLTYLAAVLRQDPAMVKKNLAAQTSIAWLARDLRADAAPELERLKLPGVHAVREFRRFYPAGADAAHVTGFYHDGHGIAGLEYAYDRLQVERIPGAVPDDDGAVESVRPVNAQLIAGVDLDLQRRLAAGLAAELEATKATGACAVALDAATGEVLAMASQPAFDPNRIGATDSASLPNRVMTLSLNGELLSRLAGLLSGSGEVTPENNADFWQPAADAADAADDMYLSRELAALPVVDRRQQPQWLRDAADVTLFASSFDQQASRVRGLTAIGLANVMAALVNGGRWLFPHLLVAAVDEKFHRLRYAVYLPEAGAEEAQGPFRDGAFFAEALLGLPTLDEVETKPAKQTAAARPMRQAVLVGVSGKKRVLVIALENPEIVMEHGSPLRTLAADLLARADKIPPFDPPAPGSLAVDNREMFARWQEARGGEPPLAPPLPEAIMPAVTGLSLRKALRTLQPFGLQCTVRGSGEVVGQEPKAGAPLTSSACALRLEAAGL